MRYYKYNMYKGVKKLKTKASLAIAGGIASLASLFLALGMPLSAHAVVSNNYTLFGDASIVASGNPGSAAQMVSNTGTVDTSDDFGGVDYAVPAGMTFSQLTNLGTDYKITAGDCGGGSPRFQVNVGGHNIFVYIGPSPNYTGCTTNSWVSTGNLTASADPIFDTSQYAGGNFYSTYAQAETLLRSQTVTGIQLVTDAGWAVTGSNQTILADNTQINESTYTYEPAPVLTKDSCKNNGWKSMTNPGPFKNQGDCVSYFATNGKNLPAVQH